MPYIPSGTHYIVVEKDGRRDVVKIYNTSDEDTARGRYETLRLLRGLPSQEQVEFIRFQ